MTSLPRERRAGNIAFPANLPVLVTESAASTGLPVAKVPTTSTAGHFPNLNFVMVDARSPWQGHVALSLPLGPSYDRTLGAVLVQAYREAVLATDGRSVGARMLLCAETPGLESTLARLRELPVSEEADETHVRAGLALRTLLSWDAAVYRVGRGARLAKARRYDSTEDLVRELREAGCEIEAALADAFRSRCTDACAIRVDARAFRVLEACASFDFREFEAVDARFNGARPFSVIPAADGCYLLADREWYGALRADWLPRYHSTVPLYPLLQRQWCYLERSAWLTRRRRHAALRVLLSWVDPASRKRSPGRWLLGPDDPGFVTYAYLFRLLGRWMPDGDGQGARLVLTAIHDAQFGPREDPSRPAARSNVVDAIRTFLLLGRERVIRAGVLHRVRTAFASDPFLAAAYPEAHAVVIATEVANVRAPAPFDQYYELGGRSDPLECAYYLYELAALPADPVAPSLPHETARDLFLSFRLRPPTPSEALHRRVPTVLRSRASGCVGEKRRRVVGAVSGLTATSVADAAQQTLLHDADSTASPATAHLYGYVAVVWLSALERASLQGAVLPKNPPRTATTDGGPLLLFQDAVVTRERGHRPTNASVLVDCTVELEKGGRRPTYVLRNEFYDDASFPVSCDESSQTRDTLFADANLDWHLLETVYCLAQPYLDLLRGTKTLKRTRECADEEPAKRRRTPQT